MEKAEGVGDFGISAENPGWKWQAREAHESRLMHLYDPDPSLGIQVYESTRP